jgi:hypothetical protein
VRLIPFIFVKSAPASPKQRVFGDAFTKWPEKTFFFSPITSMTLLWIGSFTLCSETASFEHGVLNRLNPGAD